MRVEDDVVRGLPALTTFISETRAEEVLMALVTVGSLDLSVTYDQMGWSEALDKAAVEAAKDPRLKLVAADLLEAQAPVDSPPRVIKWSYGAGCFGCTAGMPWSSLGPSF